MTTKKRKKLLALCLSLVMLVSIIPLQVILVQPVKAAGYGINNPRTDKNGVSTWDCIYFGSYYQSNRTTKEPIKWRVLSVNGDDAFLLADKTLDCQPYNTENKDVTWETCTLRNWLNNDFYNAAFSAAEKSAIKTSLVVNKDNPEYGTEGGNNTNDKVYLLSIQEAMNSSYGFLSSYNDTETRQAENTEYVKEHGVWIDVNDKYSRNGVWWLRSPLPPGDYYLSNVAVVDRKGYVNRVDNYVTLSTIAVRPALHLNISSEGWSKVGTVSARGDNTEGSTEESTNKPAGTDKTTQTSTSKSIAKPTRTEKPKTSLKPTNKQTKITAPGKVKKLTAQNKNKKSVTLTWKKVSGAKGYQIQYAFNKKFAKKKSKLTTKTKFTIKKLKKKKTYYFRVRAYKLSGQKKVYGKWSGVKKVKIKK